MVVSLYEELINLDKAGPAEVNRKLIELGLADIFVYLVNEQTYHGCTGAVVAYAAYAYSWESTMVRLGSDWLATKKKIAIKVGLPDYLYNEVVHLQDKNLADAFIQFLNLYHENADYVHMTSLKEVYQMTMRQAMRFNIDDAGNDDLKVKAKNLEIATDFKNQIKEAEEECAAVYRKLHPAKDEFKYVQTEHGNPLLPENSTFIK